MSKLENIGIEFWVRIDDTGISDYYFVPHGDWDNVKQLGSGTNHRCHIGQYGHRFLSFETDCKNGQISKKYLYNDVGDCLFSDFVERMTVDVKKGVFRVEREGKVMEMPLDNTKCHSGLKRFLCHKNWFGRLVGKEYMR